MKPLNTLLNFLLLKQKNTASEVTELITCSLFIRKNIHRGPCLQHVLSPRYSWKIGITTYLTEFLRAR